MQSNRGRTLLRSQSGGIAAASLSLFLCQSASALVLQSPAQELVDRSGIVAIGSVVRQHAERLGASNAIYTITELRVEQTLKGEPMPTLEVVSAGGTIPGEPLGQWVSDQAQFSVGERVLVALEPTEIGSEARRLVTDRMHGRIRLDRDLKPQAGESAVSFIRRLRKETSATTRAAAIPQDFYSVALHEQGHVAGHGDIYNSLSDASIYIPCMGTNNNSKVMFGVSQAGTQKRTFANADVLGMQVLYGSTRLPVAPGNQNENLFTLDCFRNGGLALDCSSVACDVPSKWGTLPLAFLIHQADFTAEHVSMLQQGMQQWDGTARNNFSARFAGDTPVDRSFVCDETKVFRVSNPGDPDDAMAIGGSTLAVTATCFFTQSGLLADADITFNFSVEYNPALPVAPRPTATPVPQDNDDGGGCGPVQGVTPPSGPGGPGLGLVLLLGVVALSLRWRSRTALRAGRRLEAA